jgi:hypothetical protein
MNRGRRGRRSFERIMKIVSSVVRSFFRLNNGGRWRLRGLMFFEAMKQIFGSGFIFFRKRGENFFGDLAAFIGAQKEGGNDSDRKADGKRGKTIV